MKKIPLITIVIMLVLLSAPLVMAQQSQAVLKGRVQDEEGKVLVGAQLVAEHIDTGVVWRVSTNEQGRYQFLKLPPGPYKITVTANNYQEKVIEGLTLSVGQNAHFPVTMKLGNFEDVLVITSETPLVETDTAEVSMLIGEELIKSIPTKNRDFEDLTLLAPGVTANNNESMGVGLSVNGMRGFSNTFILDGVSNDDPYVGGNISNISQDAIREFDVMTHMANAEFGQATGGIVNIATRSGTNDYHGSASMFYRDESMMEKPHFADEKPPFSRLIFSGTFGGPIVQDKAHFFVNYEGQDNDEEVVITAPLEFGKTVPSGSTTHIWFAKLDYLLNESNSFTIRTNGSKWENPSDGVGGYNLTETAYSATNNTISILGTYTNYMSDNFLNEVRLVYSKKDWSGESDNTDITAFHPLGNFGSILGVPYEENSSKTQFIYNGTYLMQNHTIKFGADIARHGTWGDSTNWANGAWNFSTNDPFDPNDLSTYPYLYRQSVNTTTEYDVPQNGYGIFAQDQWDLADNLTLNVGLRWDYEDFWERMDDAGTVSGEPVDADNDNIQPRVALTWQPFSDGKTTVRAGYGRFYDQVPTNEAVFIYLNTVNAIGFLFLWGDTFGNEYDTIPLYPNRPDYRDYFEAGGDTGADFLDSELRLPHLDQFVIGFSHQLTDNTAIHMDFTYNEAKDLWLLTNANPVDPVTGQRPYDYDADMYSQSSIGESEYKGLMTRLEHRFGSGQVNVSYTLASSYDNMQGDPNASPVFNAFDPMEDWGPGINDIRHRLVVSGYVVLPFEISASGTFTYRSAAPYTAQSPDDLNGDGIFWDIAEGYERGDQRGDDFYSLDMRLGKIFIVDRYRLEVFLEGYNLTNSVNYTSYVARVDFDTFGTPSGAADMRILQLGMRFDF